MVKQIINPDRQEKKMLMKKLGLKSSKQFRKWMKKFRRSPEELKAFFKENDIKLLELVEYMRKRNKKNGKTIKKGLL